MFLIVFFPIQAIEEGVNHMWTVSALQQHANTVMVCDESATLELRVKTVKYFKNLWDVHQNLTVETHAASQVTSAIQVKRSQSVGEKLN